MQTAPFLIALSSRILSDNYYREANVNPSCVKFKVVNTNRDRSQVDNHLAIVEFDIVKIAVQPLPKRIKYVDNLWCCF